MRTRSSSNLPVVSPSNPSTSNPKRRNHRRSKQPFILEESPIVTMTDQCTMAELLRAPTEGYAEAIVVPLILAEKFELKHILINMMTSDQFFGLEKDNPHDHIRWAARRWLEKEPLRSIHTWEDLVSKFINEFFPPSRTTNLRNEISNFKQWFDESFHEAWDRYKDLLRVCPHHVFTELHQLDTFYNALNPADQDSLNSAVGGNLLERRTQDVLTIIENKSKCLAAGGNTFPELRDTIQGYVSVAAVNYNQGNAVYHPPGMANQIRPPGFAQPNASLSNQTNEIKNTMASLFQINTASTLGLGSLPSNIVANPKGELKAITTRSGLVLDGPTIPTPSPFINLELHVNITLADALILMPKYQKMLKALLSNKEKLQELANTPLNENCSVIILKKLPEKFGDPRKFLIPCGFNELKCNALANLAGIVRDVFVPVCKFTFPVDFVIVDYESDPRVPFILGRPFLRTAHALIDVHGEEMILRDEYDNDLQFDIESDFKKIEYLLHHDPIKDLDSSLKDSIDQSSLADLHNHFVDYMREMFTDEHALDYSSPMIFDEYDDDF
nr:reverse transcriptase domain-containing protein [Tanacetum cinerariifolium]